MKLLLLVLLFSLAACSSLSSKGLQPRTIEDYYTTTGVEKYFLTDIPPWANFDQTAACYRSSQLRYFDIEALMKSYGLSYAKAIQVQATYNEEVVQFKGTDDKRIPTLKEEELLFYKVSEKVSNKFIFFDPPTFKQINLVWLDEIIGDGKKEKKLKAFLHSPAMDAGVPVLFSFCLTRAEVEKKYPDLGAKMITAEMLSVFNSDGSRSPFFQIDLGQFFSKTQRLYFYSQKSSDMSEQIKGLFKNLTY